MDAGTFIKRLQRESFFKDQIVHVRTLAEREAVCRPVAGGLAEPLAVGLGRLGIPQLYEHQAAALEAVRGEGTG